MLAVASSTTSPSAPSTCMASARRPVLVQSASRRTLARRASAGPASDDIAAARADSSAIAAALAVPGRIRPDTSATAESPWFASDG
jgi:hypothetical protein